MEEDDDSSCSASEDYEQSSYTVSTTVESEQNTCEPSDSDTSFEDSLLSEAAINEFLANDTTNKESNSCPPSILVKRRDIESQFDVEQIPQPNGMVRHPLSPKKPGVRFVIEPDRGQFYSSDEEQNYSECGLGGSLDTTGKTSIYNSKIPETGPEGDVTHALQSLWKQIDIEREKGERLLVMGKQVKQSVTKFLDIVARYGQNRMSAESLQNSSKLEWEYPVTGIKSMFMENSEKLGQSRTTLLSASSSRHSITDHQRPPLETFATHTMDDCQTLPTLSKLPMEEPDQFLPTGQQYGRSGFNICQAIETTVTNSHTHIGKPNYIQTSNLDYFEAESRCKCSSSKSASVHYIGLERENTVNNSVLSASRHSIGGSFYKLDHATNGPSTSFAVGGVYDTPPVRRYCGEFEATDSEKQFADARPDFRQITSYNEDSEIKRPYSSMPSASWHSPIRQTKMQNDFSAKLVNAQPLQLKMKAVTKKYTVDDEPSQKSFLHGYRNIQDSKGGHQSYRQRSQSLSRPVESKGTPDRASRHDRKPHGFKALSDKVVMPIARISEEVHKEKYTCDFNNSCNITGMYAHRPWTKLETVLEEVDNDVTQPIRMMSKLPSYESCRGETFSHATRDQNSIYLNNANIKTVCTHGHDRVGWSWCKHRSAMNTCRVPVNATDASGAMQAHEFEPKYEDDADDDADDNHREYDFYKASDTPSFEQSMELMDPADRTLFCCWNTDLPLPPM